MRFWTITAKSNGAVIAPCVATGDLEVPAASNGWPWDANTQNAIRITQRPDIAVQIFDGTKWVEDPAKVEATLIDQVKATNAALVAGAYTTAFGKQKKYSRKQQEALDYRALTPAVGFVGDLATAALSVFNSGFSAMSTVNKRKKFRFAMAQAALRGVTIDVIIGEYETAIDSIETKVAAWEAIELEGIRAIKAATTAAAKRAAFAGINWAWTMP